VSFVPKVVSRRWRRPGPAGSGILTLPHADIRFRSAFDADYSLPHSHLLRVAAPRTIQVDLCATRKDSLGFDFERLPEDQAAEVCRRIDEEREKHGLPKKGILRHVFVHLTFGPQVVYHQPFSTGNPGDPANSAELDMTLQGDVNLVFHDTDDDDKEESGFEFTVAVQGSGNWFVLDPNRDNPAFSKAELDKSSLAAQAQLQLQAAYVFKSFEIAGLKLQFQFLLQAAGAVTYQYDPSKRKAGTSYSVAGAFGGELDIEIAKDTNFALQCTGGPNSGGTVDGTCGAFIKIQFDTAPKKKK